jgi:hypothetical protein
MAFAATLTMTSCNLGQPGSFTARAEKYCASAARTLAADTPVTDPVAYAIDRFAAVDRVLVIVSTDRGFPGGPNGVALHSVWIVPARASLKAARPGLDTLRQVADTPTAQRTRAFTTAARAGDGGVRVSMLRRLGLPKCAALFNQPVPRLVS